MDQKAIVCPRLRCEKAFTRARKGARVRRRTASWRRRAQCHRSADRRAGSRGRRRARRGFAGSAQRGRRCARALRPHQSPAAPRGLPTQTAGMLQRERLPLFTRMTILY